MDSYNENTSEGGLLVAVSRRSFILWFNLETIWKQMRSLSAKRLS